jgi:glycosyltransferase involved in cell wall biosynthesis
LKVAYELANGLAMRGHRVVVLHQAPSTAAPSPARRFRLALAGRGFGGWVRFARGVEPGWIDPDQPEKLPPADELIAVGWKGVALVAAASPAAGRAHYLAMDYMAPWEGKPGDVDSAWRTPMPKIVTARWLVAKAREVCGENVDVHYIPLGIGAEHRFVIDPASRRPDNVLMHHHPAPQKGFTDGLRALENIHGDRPISVDIFGASRPEMRLPEWARFHLRPRSLESLYNRAAVFVHSSRHEGFGLPPAEAMASGCAVAAFGNVGLREYAVDERNALLVEVGDVAGLAAAVRRLIEDEPLRLRLAAQGAADIAAYTWDRSVAALEAALVTP